MHDSCPGCSAARPIRLLDLSRSSTIIEEIRAMADFPPAHPGEVLREDFLKPLHLSQYALAKAIGVPQIRISEIVNGKRAITPDTALRLAPTLEQAPNSGWACRRPTTSKWRAMK